MHICPLCGAKFVYTHMARGFSCAKCGYVEPITNYQEAYKSLLDEFETHRLDVANAYNAIRQLYTEEKKLNKILWFWNIFLCLLLSIITILAFG